MKMKKISILALSFLFIGITSISAQNSTEKVKKENTKYPKVEKETLIRKILKLKINTLRKNLLVVNLKKKKSNNKSKKKTNCSKAQKRNL